MKKEVKFSKEERKERFKNRHLRRFVRNRLSSQKVKMASAPIEPLGERYSLQDLRELFASENVLKNDKSPWNSIISDTENKPKNKYNPHQGKAERLRRTKGRG